MLESTTKLARPELLKYRRQYIKSMLVLIDRYEKAISLGISKTEYERMENLKCLLCYPIGVKKDSGSCSNAGCPWFVIKGTSCGHSSFDESTNKTQQVYRINQLKQWIDIYKTVRVREIK